MSNIIDDNLFKQIFGHTFMKLADQLINTKTKEEKQIILNNIRKNKDKIYKKNKKQVMVMSMWSSLAINVMI